MKKYEYFCVLAQELTEDEAQGLLSTIKQALSDVGAENINDQTLGKQRLAYPFPGRQAYGTFVLILFDAEPEVIDQFKEKIRFVKGISRAVVRVFAGKEEKKKKSDAQFVALTEDEVSVRGGSTSDVEGVVLSPEVVVRTADVKEDVVKSEPEPVVEEKKKEEKKTVLSQEELDKRIDALLAEEIDPDTL